MGKFIILRSKDERVVNSVIFDEKNSKFTYCDRVTDIQLAKLLKKGYDVSSYNLAVGAELKIPQTKSYPPFTVSVVPKRGQKQGEDRYEIVVDGMLATKVKERDKDDNVAQNPDNFNYNYNKNPESKEKFEQVEKGIELEK